MDTKLTLKLEGQIIEKAKKYAKEKNTSLSRMIENYLMKLLKEQKDIEITPLVKSLSGIIHQNDIAKVDYADYLIEKYK